MNQMEYIDLAMKKIAVRGQSFDLRIDRETLRPLPSRSGRGGAPGGGGQNAAKTQQYKFNFQRHLLLSKALAEASENPSEKQIFSESFGLQIECAPH